MANALIIGASGGIGCALVQDLRRRGEIVTGLSRSVDGLDVTDEQSIEDVLGRLEGSYDKIVVATGALSGGTTGPEKTIRAMNSSALAAQFAVNAAGPVLVLKHALRLIPRDRRSVFVALSARVGSIGDNRLGGWYSYRASKAALNQLVHTAAIELARSHRHAICCALHPGTIETAFTKNYRGAPAVSAQDAAANLLGVVDRLKISDSGGFFDWAGNAVTW